MSSLRLKPTKSFKNASSRGTNLSPDGSAKTAYFEASQQKKASDILEVSTSLSVLFAQLEIKKANFSDALNKVKMLEEKCDREVQKLVQNEQVMVERTKQIEIMKKTVQEDEEKLNAELEDAKKINSQLVEEVERISKASTKRKLDQVSMADELAEMDRRLQKLRVQTAANFIPQQMNIDVQTNVKEVYSSSFPHRQSEREKEVGLGEFSNSAIRNSYIHLQEECLVPTLTESVCSFGEFHRTMFQDSFYSYCQKRFEEGKLNLPKFENTEDLHFMPHWSNV